MVNEKEQGSSYLPQTELGKKLLELRDSYIARGGILLAEKELDSELEKFFAENWQDFLA